jgi:hypothetical protein
MKTYPKLVLVIAVIISLFSCSKKTPEQKIHEVVASKANFQVNQFILDKFKDHRIVMLADAGHESGDFLRTASSFLDYWIDSSQPYNANLQQLVLVLEGDSLEVSRIKKYADSHEYRDLIGDKPLFWAYRSTASLEFLWRLGEITRLANEKGLKFDILGPEKVIDIDSWNIAKRDSFFLNDRDVFSSNSVINYLKANPDCKALIYYGSAHLNREKCLKKADSLSADGYYMAHYLEQEYGNKLYIINQYPVGYLEDPQAFYGPDSSFVIDNNYIGKFIDSRVSNFDATIFIQGYSEPTISLQAVKSKALAKLALDCLKASYPDENEFYHVMNVNAIEYPFILSGLYNNNGHRNNYRHALLMIPEWEKWIDNPANDVVKEIIEQKQVGRLLDSLKTAIDTSVASNRAFLFTYYTGQQWGYNRQRANYDSQSFIKKFHSDNADDRALRIDDYEYFLQHNENLLIVTDLVQLLWVGTDQEKQEAVAELQKRTGQTFTSAPEWMKWWRGNYKKL